MTSYPFSIPTRKGTTLDKLNGNVSLYNPEHFPYQNRILGFHQAIHFVVPANELVGFFPILANYNHKSSLARSRVCLLTFAAESLERTLRYRGRQAGRSLENRVSLLLTYLPKQLHVEQEELLEPRNIAGVMLSFFLHDPDLSVDDAFADMMEINAVGEPTIRQSTRPSPEEDSDEEQLAGRPDRPNQSLKSSGRYSFHKTAKWKQERQPQGDLSAFTAIDSMASYAAKLSDLNPNLSSIHSTSGRLSEPNFRGSPLHPLEAFSLGAAVEQMRAIGTEVDLCHELRWSEPATASFGAPTLGHVRLPICAKLFDLDTPALLYNQLPHFTKLRRADIFSASKSKRVLLGGYDQEDLMDMLHMKSPAEALDEATTIPDLFNKRFERSQNLPRPATPAQIRAQGEDWLDRLLLCVDDSQLPDGFRAVRAYFCNSTDAIAVDELILEDRRLHPFSQWIVKDLNSYSLCLQADDAHLLHIRSVFLAACSVGLPKEASWLPLNTQLIGTSMSSPLALVPKLLIPETYRIRPTEAKGANLSALGGSASQRLVELMDNLPRVLYPGSDGILRTDLPLKLSTGKFAMQDPTGEHNKIVVDFTNLIIGCATPSEKPLKAHSTAAAVRSLFQVEHLYQPVVDRFRRKVAQALVDSDQVRVNHQFRHGMAMLYGSAIASFAVPLPDLQLQKDLLPLSLKSVSKLRPESETVTPLRHLETNTFVEVINHAIRLATVSPLSPLFAHKAAFLPTEVDFRKIREEIARYCYMTYEIFVFTVTKFVFQFLGASNLDLLRYLAESESDYKCRGPDDNEAGTWPTQIDDELVSEDLRSISMGAILAEFLGREPLYCLGVPKKEGRKWTEADLLDVLEYQPKPKRDRYPPPLVNRLASPQYKVECKDGIKYLNPNYVVVKGSFSSLQKRFGGITVGGVQLTPSQVLASLNELACQCMQVPYMPCLDPRSRLTQAMDLIQSLRYSREAMSRFPVCEVPVILESAKKTYVLVAALETDVRVVCRDAVDQIRYAGTPTRTVFFGSPAEGNWLEYEHYELRPEPRPLKVVDRSGEVLEIVDDIETAHARGYLKANFPGLTDEEVAAYLPAGILTRLYPDRPITAQLKQPHANRFGSEESAKRQRNAIS